MSRDVQARLQKQLADKKKSKQETQPQKSSQQNTSAIQFLPSFFDGVLASTKMSAQTGAVDVQEIIKSLFEQASEKADGKKLKSVVAEISKLDFSNPEKQEGFGIIVGALLHNPKLRDALRGKALTNELKQIIFSDISEGAAAAVNPSALDLPILIKSLIWALETKKFDPAESQKWQAEMSAAAVDKILNLVQQNMSLVSPEMQQRLVMMMSHSSILMNAAVKYGDDIIIKKLINFGMEIDLFPVISAGKTDLFYELIEHPRCDINKSDADVNYLHNAIAENQPQIALFLLKKGVSLNAGSDKSHDMMHEVLTNCSDETFAIISANPVIRASLDYEEFIITAVSRITNYMKQLPFIGVVEMEVIKIKIRELGKLSPKQDEKSVKEFIAGAISQSPIFVTDDFKITLMSKMIDLNQIDLLEQMLNEYSLDVDEPCLVVRGGEFYSPLKYAINCYDSQSANSTKILRTFIERSKILNSASGCEAVLAALDKELKISVPGKAEDSRREIFAAIAARKAGLAVIDEAKDAEVSNLPSLSVNLVDRVMANIYLSQSRAAAASADQRILYSIGKDLDLLSQDNPFEQFLVQRKYGILMGAALADTGLGRILVQYDLPEKNLIFTNEAVENNAENLKLLLKVLNNSLSTEFEGDENQVAFGRHRTGVVVRKMLHHLRESKFVLDRKQHAELMVNAAKHSDPDVLLELTRLGGNSESDIFNILKLYNESARQKMMQHPGIMAKLSPNQIEYLAEYSVASEAMKQVLGILNEKGDVTPEKIQKIKANIQGIQNAQLKKDLLNAFTKIDQTILNAALFKKCDSNFIRFLLAQGADCNLAVINSVNISRGNISGGEMNYEMTPLIAASKGDVESFKILCDEGADIGRYVKIQNEEITVLNMIFTNSRDEFIEYLLTRPEVDFNKPMKKSSDGGEVTPLEFCILNYLKNNSPNKDKILYHLIARVDNLDVLKKAEKSFNDELKKPHEKSPTQQLVKDAFKAKHKEFEREQAAADKADLAKLMDDFASESEPQKKMHKKPAKKPEAAKAKAEAAAAKAKAEEEEKLRKLAEEKQRIADQQAKAKAAQESKAKAEDEARAKAIAKELRKIENEKARKIAEEARLAALEQSRLSQEAAEKKLAQEREFNKGLETETDKLITPVLEIALQEVQNETDDKIKFETQERELRIQQQFQQLQQQRAILEEKAAAARAAKIEAEKAADFVAFQKVQKSFIERGMPAPEAPNPSLRLPVYTGQVVNQQQSDQSRS